MPTTDVSILASKRVVYVGGLADSVATNLVRAAFIPIGNIRNIDMPLDYKTGKHQGFCFVEFDDAEDADEAIYNLDGSELLGRTLKVSLAQPNQANKFASIWQQEQQQPQQQYSSNNTDWFQQNTTGKDKKAKEQQQRRKQDAQILQKI